jgi:malate permease and related proteins
MDSIIVILNTVVPVFLIILLGYAIGKFQKGINVQPIIDWLVFLTTPCLLIANLSKTEISLADFSTTFLSGLAIITLQAFLVFIILKITRSSKTGLLLPMVTGNTGSLGFPVMLFAFGQAGLSNAFIYDLAGTIYMFTFGIYVLHHKNDIREVFRLPILYAVIIGLVLGQLKIEIPEMLFRPIQMVGNISIPLSLIVFGYQLARIRLSTLKIASLSALFKIFIGFALAMLMVTVFNITGVSRNIIILEASMPSAIMSMILTQKYNRDADLSASIVLIATLISILTVPLILLFVTV